MHSGPRGGGRRQEETCTPLRLPFVPLVTARPGKSSNTWEANVFRLSSRRLDLQR